MTQTSLTDSPFGEASAGEAPLHAEIFEGADAGASTSTSYTIAVGDSFSGSLSAGDRDGVRIYLTAGQSYQFDLLGADSGVGTLTDPFLRLYDASGTLLASDDDGGNGYESRTSFTATTSGYYFIEAGEFGDNGSGSYTLTATSVQPPHVGTLDELADYLVNGYWEYTGRAARRFDTSSSSIITVDIQNLTAEGQQLARWAFQAWSAVANIQFQEITGAAMIEFDDSASGAYSSSVVSGSFITSSLVNVSTDWLAGSGTTIDTYSLQTYIHEIGHAIGLGHQGPYNGSASYPTNAYLLNDSWQMSIMSYFSQTDNTTTGASYAYITSAMMADIVAIQSMYGVSSASAGNTVYGGNSTVGGYMGLLYSALASGGTTSSCSGNDVAMTIFDMGGRDFIDVSFSSANQVLNLGAETISNVAGLIGNLTIARGTVIEVGITGSGNDMLIGSSAANTLQSGAGNDSIWGGAGNDTLNGGTGTDSMLGGAGNDRYIVDAATDRVFETTTMAGTVNAGGLDTIISSVSINMNATAGVRFVENLSLTGAANLTASGNSLANTMIGNDGNNLLAGGLGLDRLTGGLGRDVFLFNTAPSAANADVIVDFSVVNDTIQLENAIYTGLATGTLAASAFVSNTTGLAADALDRVIYETDSGQIWFDSDGTGAATRALIATVTAGLALTTADFVIV